MLRVTGINTMCSEHKIFLTILTSISKEDRKKEKKRKVEKLIILITYLIYESGVLLILHVQNTICRINIHILQRNITIIQY